MHVSQVESGNGSLDDFFNWYAVEAYQNFKLL